MVNASVMILTESCGTRVGESLDGIALSAVVLLLVFIMGQPRVDIRGFGAHARLPLGVALLLAAVLKSCWP
jgi:hypothetical protein